MYDRWPLSWQTDVFSLDLEPFWLDNIYEIGKTVASLATSTKCNLKTTNDFILIKILAMMFLKQCSRRWVYNIHSITWLDISSVNDLKMVPVFVRSFVFPMDWFFLPVSRNKVSPIKKSPVGGNISSPQEEIFPPPRAIFCPPHEIHSPLEIKSPPWC